MCTLRDLLLALEDASEGVTEDVEIQARNEVGEWESIDSEYRIVLTEDQYGNQVIRLN